MKGMFIDGVLTDYGVQEMAHPLTVTLVNEFYGERIKEGTFYRRVSRSLSYLCTWIYHERDNIAITDLRQKDAQEFTDYLIDIDISQDNIGRYRSQINRFYEYVNENYSDIFGNIPQPFFKRRRRRQQKSRRALDKREYNKISRHLKEKGRLNELAYLSLAFFCGMLPSEAIQLKKEIVYNDKFRNFIGNRVEWHSSGPVESYNHATGEYRTVFYKIDDYVMERLRLLVDNYDTDSEYIFSFIDNEGDTQRYKENTIHKWGRDWTNVVGRPVSTKVVLERVKPGAMRMHYEDMEMFQPRYILDKYNIT